MKYDFMDRDLSAMSFNRRVLYQANGNIPLQEKLFLMGVVYSNLDEFLMSRYPRKLKEKNSFISSQDIQDEVIDVYNEVTFDFSDINKRFKLIANYNDIIGEKIRGRLTDYFKKNIFPVISTKRVQQGVTPKSNEVNIFVHTTHLKSGESYYHNISIPNSLDRFIEVPEMQSYILIEDLISSNLREIFKGYEVVENVQYTILRSFNMDMVEGKDIEEVIEKSLKNLNKAWITQLEVVNLSKNKKLVKVLKSQLGIEDETVIIDSDYVGLNCLREYPTKYFNPDQMARKLKRYNPLPSKASIFDIIKENDQLITHPFESFDDTVLRFIREASSDPQVISIKMTLYRVAKDSKIVKYLLDAVDRGKSVTVMVELKARFNERDNLNIASVMKQSGVDIIYSDEITKTHAKMCIITRQEADKVRIYSHIGTGNYSEANSKIYTDYSYFTRSTAIGKELSEFFNIVTGSSESFKADYLLYAPHTMRSNIYSLIDEQIERAKKDKSARIIMKCNAFTDEKMAKRIYDAAKAGVKIKLIIRGASIINPNLEELNGNIKVYSIVGRFLEHSRVYIFGKGDNEKLYIGSADMMERNLTQRNELLLNIKDKDSVKLIKSHIALYFQDTVNLFRIHDNYKFKAVSKKREFNAHEHLIKNAKKRSV